MVPARREEHGVPPVATRYLEAQYVTVEGEGAVEVGDREVDVPNAGVRINGHHCMNAREFHDVMTLGCKWLWSIRTTWRRGVVQRVRFS